MNKVDEFPIKKEKRKKKKIVGCKVLHMHWFRGVIVHACCLGSKCKRG